MASKSVNVSAAIRAHLKLHPGEPTGIAAKILSRALGTKVSPSYVSNIKSSLRKQKPDAASPKPAKPATSRKSTTAKRQKTTIAAARHLLIAVRAIKDLLDQGYTPALLKGLINELAS